METGTINLSASSKKTRSRCPLQAQFQRRRNPRENLDRFILNCSAMDFDFAHYMLTVGKNSDENPVISSPAYMKQLAEACNRPEREFWLLRISHQHRSRPFRANLRRLPQTCQTPSLHSPDSGQDVRCSRGFGRLVFEFTGLGSPTTFFPLFLELLTVDEESRPVTSVKWAPDGRQITVGLNNSEVQLWDLSSKEKLTTLKHVAQRAICSPDSH